MQKKAQKEEKNQRSTEVFRIIRNERNIGRPIKSEKHGDEKLN
jgi:hypothetical protein